MYEIILSLSLAYLVGSVPFGFIFAKLYGLGDLRSHGSGNVGATNALRVGGRKLAILTLLGDAAKGSASIWLGHFAAAHGAHLPWPLRPDALSFLHGCMAILGHIFPIFLKFRGGKGVATFLGTLLGFSPLLALVFICSWLAAAFVSKYSSLAALIAIWLCCDLVTLTYGYPPLSVLFMGIAIIITLCHRANIARLLTGREHKIKGKANGSE